MAHNTPGATDHGGFALIKDVVGGARIKGHIGRRWLTLAACGVLALGAATAIACGDDDKDTSSGSTPAATKAPATPAVSADQKAVQQVLLDAFGRWNAKDLEGFTALFTDEGLVSSFGEDGTTVEEAKSGLAEFLGSEELALSSFGETSVSGTTATMDATFALGVLLTHSKFGLVKVGADWKLNAEESNLDVPVPAGATLVHVDGNEFAFGVDTSEIKGTIAFEFANVGKQQHMLGLAKIPADGAVADLVKQIDESPDGEVPGVTFIGSADADPGDTTNLVFAKPLESGRYMMICFIHDEAGGDDGAAHSVLGMYKEFTVE